MSTTIIPSPPLTRQLRRFAVAAMACAVAAAAYVVWTSIRLGGDAASVAVMDFGQVAAAIFAAAAAAKRAMGTNGKLSLGWTLLAASAATWALGECAWSTYEVLLGDAVPFPSVADAGFFLSIGIAQVGVVMFPSTPATTGNRLRAFLDGAVVASTLVFVSWMLGLGDVFLHTSAPLLARALALSYPAGDLVIVTLLVMGARRRVGALRVPLLLLLGAFVARTVADGSFAQLTLAGTNTTLGNPFYTGWVLGLLMLGLAALWPVAEANVQSADEPAGFWELAFPWAAVVVAMGVLGVMSLTGHAPDSIATGLGAGMGVCFLLGQGLVLQDSVRLIGVSRRAEAKLAERTALLNEIILNAPLGIARIGDDMRIIDANAAAGAMLGASSQIMLGSSTREFLSPELVARMVEDCDRLRRAEVEAATAEGTARRADGSEVWLRLHFSAVHDVRGHFEYFVAMLEDLTARHETEEAARANTAELERINRLKSEFMSMVSHEFRTALTGIQGYSELMHGEEVTPEEVKEFSGDIYSDALRLNRMITEMLDLDRIESGRIKLALAPVDVNQIVRDAIGRAQVATSKHTITANLDPQLPAVKGDGDRIVQVVSNLLSNAIKYSSGGGEVHVTSSVAGRYIQVDVEDHGQGIPEEFISRIFGRYERYVAQGGRQVVGTGLGLAISQQIVLLHGGRIWLESTVGKGSTFHFTIATDLQAEARLPEPAAPAVPAPAPAAPAAA